MPVVESFNLIKINNHINYSTTEMHSNFISVSFVLTFIFVNKLQSTVYNNPSNYRGFYCIVLFEVKST